MKNGYIKDGKFAEHVFFDKGAKVLFTGLNEDIEFYKNDETWMNHISNYQDIDINEEFKYDSKCSLSKYCREFGSTDCVITFHKISRINWKEIFNRKGLKEEYNNLLYYRNYH